MKNIYKYPAFLFVMLLASALVSNAQSTNAPVQQETAQVAPAEAFFGIEPLDDARNKVEESYIKYQGAPADQQLALGAEFRHLRRLYMVELEKQSANYPNNTPTGAKIHSEMISVNRDLR